MRSELSLSLIASWLMGDVLEDVVVPEDRVFYELLVGDCPDRPAVVVDSELEYVPLDAKIDVVMEQSFGS